MIASRWKLTHDPTGTPRVLLDNGEAMEGELPWQLEHAFEAVPLVDATWQLLLDGKSSLISLDFTVRRIAATDVDARAAVLDALVVEAAATLKPLKIQLYATAGLVTGYHYLIAQCGVKTHAPSRAEEGGKAYYLQRYSLLGSGITKVLTP